MILSVTRLRLRYWWRTPQFLLTTTAAKNQAQEAEGFVTGAVFADRGGVYWTATVWTNEAAMRAYVRTGAHRVALGKLASWCDEATTLTQIRRDASLPPWSTLHQSLITEGRVIRVERPSPQHALRQFAPPAEGRRSVLPMHPKRA